MEIYNHALGGGQDKIHPQYEVKNNKVYATLYNKEMAGHNRSMPIYEIKGKDIHRTAFHPEGHSVTPVFEIRGGNIHTTIHNSAHTPMPVFRIK
jgi:hypothetical protein